MIVNKEDVVSEFREFGINIKEDSILRKICGLCGQYKLNAENFAETWLAFSTNNQLDNLPTIDHLSRLENEELNRKKVHKTCDARKDDSGNTSVADIFGDVEELLMTYGTPEIQMAKKRQRTPETFTSRKLNISDSTPSSSPVVYSPFSRVNVTPSAKYASRTNMGDVVCEFGNAAGKINWQNSQPRQCTLTSYDENSTTGSYRYMFEKLRCSSRFLNSTIEAMEDLFKEKYSIEEFSHVHVPCTSAVEVVGRICCDGNGKLNASSIMLEGSHQTSTGMVTELDVSQLQSYSFFPGQIVTLTGTNPTGKKFIGQKLFGDIYPSLPATLLSFSDNDGPLQIMIAAGPYMTVDSLSYEPLEDLLKVAQGSQPHACILIGPFVDARHPELETGSFQQTYDEIFSECMNLIYNYVTVMPLTQFIIVSSLRDVHHDCIYPTPPFVPSAKMKNCNNVHFVSDPSILNLDGVIVAVTATDILFHLGKEEISFPPGAPDRMGRLASHLLSQHSFYPLYPPAEDVPIHLDQFEQAAKLGVTPHILILPSDLNCFIKSVKGCCCVNPQRVTRGIGAGTFARVQISPNRPEQDSSLIDCIVGQVIRI